MRKIAIAMEDAQVLLGPVHRPLSRVVRNSWQRWREDFQPQLPLWTTRAKRNVMADLMYDEARSILGDIGGVDIRESSDGRFWVEYGGVLLFFKHLREGTAISNYPTNAALRFNGQLPLFGIPDTRLIVGYETNAVETDLLAVKIVCRFNDRLLWAYELAEPSATNIIVFPTQGKFELDGTPRVRPVDSGNGEQKRKKKEDK